VATLLTRCRICGQGALEPILSLGEMPSINAFLPDASFIAAEQSYPLAIAHCGGCSHVQLTHMLDPKDTFETYLYFSSMASTIVAWGHTLSARYAKELALESSQLVAEVASNDGCILKPFRAQVRVLGVEPARNIAEVAVREGVPTVAEFFNLAQARKLREAHGPARLVIARNVLAHVPDLIDFVQGARHWLADDGIFHVEVPYLRPMVDLLEFDTIYHEHLSYFSVTALERLFQAAGMVLWDVEEIPLHGGSLVARARRDGEARPAVAALLEKERKGGYTGAAKLHQFAARARRLRTAIPELLQNLKAQGTLAAYGAAAKGVVLTNYCGVTVETLPWVADKSPHKQGRLLPGSHIPVVPPDRVLAEQPRHLVVLAWNFFEEIARQLETYTSRGGRLILPVAPPGH
jgi:novobiocin biosynthesis protein NovU/D-mycarose 3-C-methyltransferase